jgi:uncharacterized membrane protein YkvA (DUF1232 family)
MAKRTAVSRKDSINCADQTLRQQALPILGCPPDYGRLVYALATTSELSTRDKAALYLTLGYQISPVELLPGFIPVIGQLDDLLVLFWGIRRALAALPVERAAVVFAAVHLIRTQLDTDTEVIRCALTELRTHATRTLSHLFTTGAYLGVLTYHFITGPHVTEK